MNIESLKFNLISMYSVDELRRVFTETIVPLAQKKFILKRSKLVDTNQFIEVSLFYFQRINFKKLSFQNMSLSMIT